MRTTLKALALALLVFVCGGVIFDPFWWYRLVYRHQYADSGLWWEPAGYAIALGWSILFTLITIISILTLSRTEFPEKLTRFLQSFWKGWVIGSKRYWTYIILLILFFAGLLTSKIRSGDEQKLAASIQESQDTLAKLQLESKDLTNKNKPPLSEPTAFLFLDKDIVESLYGQYSPDLEQTAAIDEITNSEDLKGELNVKDYLKTSLGQQHLQKQILQYHNSVKTPERKLKERRQLPRSAILA